MARFATLGTTLALVAALAGCSHGAPGAAVSFKAVAAKGAAAAAKAPQAPAAPKAAGSLQVSFKGLLPARTLMATEAVAASVARVIVTVTAANGTTQTKTLERAAIAASPVVTFEGVPVGPATLVVEAFDAAGNALGKGESSATVAARATARVGLTVRLASTGSLAGDVVFVDDVGPAASPTPTPAPTLAPTPTPTALPTASPTPTATATPWVPGFLASTAPTRQYTAVWGRLYDYSGAQLPSGAVTLTSTDPAVPFEAVVGMRTDGYFHVPNAPVGVPLEFAATSGDLGGVELHTLGVTADGYTWIDMFVAPRGVTPTPAPTWFPSPGSWWW